MKKFFSIAKNIVLWLLTLSTICTVALTLVATKALNPNGQSLLGYHFFLVTSNSMSATDFSAGDLIFSRAVNPATLKDGDIITYKTKNPNVPEDTITHKIRAKTLDAKGNPGFITYGTTTNSNDEGVVTYNQVVSKYVGKIPQAGMFFSYLRTVPGYIIFVLMPIILLILYNAINSIRLFRKYKKEQMQTIENERQQIVEELRKNQLMVEELKRLNSSLQAKAAISLDSIEIS